MNSNYNLAIAYRIYPGVSKIPPVFSDNKFKLAELCLKSFRNSLVGINFKLWVIFDNCPDEYIYLFQNYFSNDELTVLRLNGAGNQHTFKKQIEILSEQNFSENIYFAEDDYFYLPGAFIEMLTMMNSDNGIDFLTPYDHLDYYEMDFHIYEKEYKFVNERKWKTGATTCMTFLTRKVVLNDTNNIFQSYVNGNYDTSLWMALTKIKSLNPLNILKYIFTDFWLSKVYLKALLHTPKSIFTKKKYKLWVPEPSLATHMDSLHLSPGIDWQQQFKLLN